MRLDEWAREAKTIPALEGEPGEKAHDPIRVDAFTAWWQRQRKNTPSPDDFYPLTDDNDGDGLYDDAFEEWQADGTVDRSHIGELLAEGQVMEAVDLQLFGPGGPPPDDDLDEDGDDPFIE